MVILAGHRDVAVGLALLLAACAEQHPRFLEPGGSVGSASGGASGAAGATSSAGTARTTGKTGTTGVSGGTATTTGVASASGGASGTSNAGTSSGEPGTTGGIVNGLVGHWPLDDGTGDFVEDVSGGGNHGTRAGAAVWTTGLGGGGALQFVPTTGADQYVELPVAPLLDIDTASHSVSVWSKPLSVAPGDMMDYAYTLIGRKGFHRGLAYTKDGEFEWRFWLVPGDQQAHFGLPVPTNVWYHVVGVLDFSQGESTLYVDGQVASSIVLDPAASIEPPTGPWRIGISRPGYTEYRGACHAVLDDVRLYDRVLTPAEVRALHLAGP